MTEWADIVSWVLIVLGGGFSIVGALGLIRFPDFYSRLHAGGITDTLGAWMLIAGLMFQAGLSQVTIKLALIVVFLVFTGPTSTHALGRAALHAGVKPWTKKTPSAAATPTAEEPAAMNAES